MKFIWLALLLFFRRFVQIGRAKRPLARTGLLLLVLGLNPLRLGAEQIELQSDFTGTSPAQNLPWTNTSVLSDSILFYGWTAGSGLSTTSIDDALGFYAGGTDADSTLTETLAADAYLSFALEPTAEPIPGNLQVSLGLERDNWWSARRFAVFTSIDGFEEGQELFISAPFENSDRNTPLTLTFFLPEAEITERFEMRIVPYASRYSHAVALNGFSLTSDTGTIYNLTLNASTGGAATGLPKKTFYSDGESAVLSAIPDDGFRFAGWSGALTGKGNPRSLVMNSNQTVTALFESLPDPHMEIGTNLSGICDWSIAMIFKDAFMRVRTWMTREIGSTDWQSDLQEHIPLDSNGWPLQVPFDPGTGDPEQIVHTILVAANEAGAYTLFYEGTGSFSIQIDSDDSEYLIADGTAQTHPLTLDRYSRVTLTLHESGPSPDHLRNFKLVPDTYLTNFETDPFHPLFMERSAGFSVYRFMDWIQTNNSDLENWDDRTGPEYYTQSRDEGVATEWIIRFCNQQNRDAWICIPHQADDDFVRQTAQLLLEELNPDLQVYVEYSNETWNSIFSQLNYTYEQGVAHNLDENEWTAANKYSAMRSSEIWALFEEEFGSENNERIIKVLATHSGSTSITQMRIDGLNDPTINTNQVFADVLAIAPYFGHNYATNELPPYTDAYPTAEEVAGSLSIEKIEEIRSQVAAQKVLANEQGLELVCYEGGQHFTGSGDASEDDTLTAILEAANRHPLMYRRYTEYLDMLQEEGVELYANFTLSGSWSSSGMWGNLETIDQPLEEATKYMALSDWTAENLDNQNLLEITQLSSEETGVSLAWRSKPDHTYQLQTSTNLTTWTVLPDTVYTEGFLVTNTVTDLDQMNPLFIRIQADD